MPSTCPRTLLQVLTGCLVVALLSSFQLLVLTVRSLPVGSAPFAGISSQSALSDLRVVMASIGAEKANLCRTRDLRRGHAQDIVDTGGAKAELLYKGDWSQKGSSHQSYLDLMKLEAEVIRGTEEDDGSSSGDDMSVPS